MPEVSVVIPTYNSARYLVEAVRSVLAQTFEDLEVIVVDDGSTDDTASVIDGIDPRVRYVRQENSGVSVARNNGVAESSARYVAFLDADDTWVPEKLTKQVEALRANPGYRLCYTAFTVTDSELKPIEVRRPRQRGTALETLLLHGNFVGGGSSTVLCEREVFTKAGGFDPSLSQCADWDMSVRLAALTDFLYLDEALVNYRQHGMNMSSDPRLLEDDSVRVLEKGFATPGIDSAITSKRRRALARNDMVLAGTYFQAGRYRDFARCAARSVSRDPRRVSYLAGFPVRVARRMSRRTGP
ncbi:MAG: glycosyltransferase family 2 protein [Solirubrobacterales bacterium]